MMSTKDRDERRAYEAVERCLMRHLMVPYVYEKVEWPAKSQERVDILAIDRAGRGEPHVVEVKYSAEDAIAAIERLMSIPSSYKWIAFFGETVSPKVSEALTAHQPLYPDEGAGRVGVIEVVRMAGDDLGANIVVKAERFSGRHFELVDEFEPAHQPVYRY